MTIAEHYEATFAPPKHFTGPVDRPQSRSIVIEVRFANGSYQAQGIDQLHDLMTRPWYGHTPTEALERLLDAPREWMVSSRRQELLGY